MKLISSFTLTLVLLLGYLNLSAQTITNYTMSDGLPSDDVICLTSHGSDMWFGTKKGVAKFDGTSWTIFNKAKYPAMPSDEITAIMVDRFDKLWIGTNSGAAVYDGNTWTTYTKDDGLGSNRINYIIETWQGYIWFAEFSGATRLIGSSLTAFGTKDGLPFGGVEYLKESGNGNIWMGTGLGGVAIYLSGIGFSKLTEDEGLISNSVTSIAIDNNNNKWVGTSDGVSVFNSFNNWKENHTILLTLPAPDTLNPVVDMKVDAKGYIWAGIYVDYLLTEGGVAYFNGVEWNDIDVSDGLIAPTVRKIAIDDQDDVWVATSAGVSRIRLFMVDAKDEIVEDANYTIYPNPTMDEIVISYDNDLNKPASVQLFNSAMQRVDIESINVTDNQIKIQLGNQPAGIYFLQLTHDFGRKIHKIIISGY